MQEDQNTRTVLLMDTCGEHSSLALFTGDVCSASALLPERAASEALLPAVRDLLDRSGTELEEITAFGIATGPGSFTGIRIGIAVAKGLCEAVRCPIFSVSRLALLGQQSLQADLAVLWAGRNALYVRFCNDAQSSSEMLVGADRFRLLSTNRSVVFAETAVRRLLGEAKSTEFVEMLAQHMYPLIATRLMTSGDDVALLDASYVRNEAATYTRPRMDTPASSL